MSRTKLTPSNPGPRAFSFVNWIVANKLDEFPELDGLTPEIAQAFFSFHDEFQASDFRVEDREAQKREAQERANAAKAAATAKRLAKIQADLALLGMSVVSDSEQAAATA